MILAGLLAAVALSDSLKIQSAKVDITPPEPLPMGGYTARGARLFEPGGDHLYARAKVISGRKQRIAIVSCEMLTIPGSLYEAVSKRIPKDTFLFLSATHTHSAPDSQMLNDRMTFSIPGIASFKERWLDWYARRIALAVVNAEKQQGVEVDNATCLQYQEPFNRGRRQGAVPDQTATTVMLNPKNSGQAGSDLFFSYAAHATLYGPERMQLSGDWPGEVARRLDCPVLVGAIGDVSPHVDGRTSEEMIHSLVAELIENKVTNRQLVIQFAGANVRALRRTIKLNVIMAHPNMGKFYHAPQPFAESIVRQFAPPAAKITALRIGKLAIIGVPGEPTSHLGRAIKAYGLSIGFRSVIVVSHVNGWMGYILGSADYDQGGYEATLSFYGRDEGAEVVKAADEALRELAGQRA